MFDKLPPNCKIVCDTIPKGCFKVEGACPVLPKPARSPRRRRPPSSPIYGRPYSPRPYSPLYGGPYSPLYGGPYSTTLYGGPYSPTLYGGPYSPRYGGRYSPRYRRRNNSQLLPRPRVKSPRGSPGWSGGPVGIKSQQGPRPVQAAGKRGGSIGRR